MVIIFLYICVYIKYCVSLKYWVHIAQKIHKDFKPQQTKNLDKLCAVCSLLLTAITQSQVKSKGEKFTSAKKKDPCTLHGDFLTVQQSILSLPSA